MYSHNVGVVEVEVVLRGGKQQRRAEGLRQTRRGLSALDGAGGERRVKKAEREYDRAELRATDGTARRASSSASSNGFPDSIAVMYESGPNNDGSQS